MDYKEKLKAIINSDNTPFVDIDTFLKYFPELKESKDEKIRKALIKYYSFDKDGGSHALDNITPEQIVTWLEKQDKKEYALKSFKDEDVHKFMQYIEKEAKAYEFNLPNRGYDIYAFAKDLLVWLEKQGEQKPADKIEPKFHEGDWIIRNNYTVVPVQVLEFKGYYRCDLNGEAVTLTLNDVHNNFHLWTIQDAKDGDILAADLIKGYSSPFVAIYKERGLDFFNSYCFVSFDGVFFKEGCTGHDTRVHPATKEQRDLLFQKMKEAGYEWDSENKELKKIEQKPAWSEEDERNFQDIDSVLFYDKCISENTCMRLRNWLKSLKDRVQPKQEWSKEDEKMIICCKIAIQFFEDAGKSTFGHPHPNYFDLSRKIFPQEVQTWLKSLKDRYIWKPSDEQMEALLYEVNAWNEDSINGQNLKSLYQDLKKLREE